MAKLTSFVLLELLQARRAPLDSRQHLVRQADRVRCIVIDRLESGSVTLLGGQNRLLGLLILDAVQLVEAVPETGMPRIFDRVVMLVEGA